MNISITHDGTFDIAIGKNRKDTNWKNKQVTWSAFLARISETHRTVETFAEYLAMKKSLQDERKDVGGFVGGYLTGGRRKSGSVLHRQLLTLDIDFGQPGVWEDFTLNYACAAAVYSTHKHSSAAPRLRLLLPLSREVACDEYQAIARRVAQGVGIELLDPTTYQPERLMYWPSTSKDGEFFFDYQDGAWLDVDQVLNSYTDWKDTSEWPVSTRESEVVTRAAKKQGDPLEKPGLVGSFCRTYSIHEAIEKFLSDAYEPCDVEDRYTYKEGSTAAGLVVYDDKFAYSHHGTDPISGKLCNAFDLVRLHKYGLKDEDAREGTPPVKLPSYLAMLDLVAADEKVKLQVAQERHSDLMADFQGLDLDAEQPGMVIGENGLEETTVIQGPPVPDYDPDWMAKLDMDRKGNYYPTIDNLVLMLENDPAIRGNLCFDLFEQRAVFCKNLPWRKVTYQTRYMTDRDADLLEHHLEKNYSISTAKMEKAVSVICERYSFHPVQEYLKSLSWDNVSRVDRLLIDYMGAEDTAYVRAVTRKTLVAAVARVFRPGVKFDHVLTLVGDEGKGKSTLIAKLGRGWFSDTFNLHMLQSKEGYEQLRGVWIVELAELSGMSGTEVERVKAFISAREDRYRVAYGRRSDNFPRQCVIIGTTNRPDFLISQTGNRRFWPVAVDISLATLSPFRDFTDEVVGQIWAEATALYKQSEPLYLPSGLEPEAVKVQKEHTVEHPWTPLIAEFLETKISENWNKMNRYEKLEFLSEDTIQVEGTMLRDRVCLMEIWEIGLKKRDTINSWDATNIRNIMRNMAGWQEEQSVARYGSYGPQRRGYFRTEEITEAIKKHL